MAEHYPPERRLLASGGEQPNQPPRTLHADYYEIAPGPEGVPLKEYLGMIRRNLWLVLGVTALVVGFATYRVMNERPLYRAGAVVRLADVRGAMAGGLGDVASERAMGGIGWSDPILSQIQILQSRALAAEVVEKQGLRLHVPSRTFSAGLLEDVQVMNAVPGDTIRLQFTGNGVSAHGRGGTAQADYGEPIEIAGVRFTVVSAPAVPSTELVVLPQDQAVNMFIGNLRATNRKGTDIIDVEYINHDPRVATRIVNAVAEEFQIANARSAQTSSRRRRIFIEEQLQQTEATLAHAQRQLTDFRSRNRVYSSAAKATAQQEMMMQVHARRAELGAERRVYQTLLGGLQRAEAGRKAEGLSGLVSAPEIAANPVITGLAAQLSQYEAARDSLTTGPWRRAATHPDVQRINTLIAQTETRLQEAARTAVQATDTRIAALDGLRAQGSAEIQATPETESEEVWLMQQAEGIRKTVEQLREEFHKAKIAEEVEAGQVEIVDLATFSAPVGSGRGRKLTFALVVGLALGAGGAMFREKLNTSIRRRDEIEGLLQVPGLAVIPQIAASNGRGKVLRLPSALRLKSGSNGTGESTAVVKQDAKDVLPDGLIAAAEVHSTGAEAYRTLRTNLIFSQAIQSLKTVVVTSASPAEGKTTTAANLAVTFAQQGMRVLLVDCDLRRARLHKVFNIPREPGFTELVLERKTASEAIQASPVDGLFVLTSGTLPPNPSEILGGVRTETLLQKLSEDFDIIVLDTPPLLAAADASILATKTDGVLLVVRAGQTERAAAQQAVNQLTTVGARVLGAVLNDPDAKVKQYGGYYQYEYYGAA